MQSVSKRVHVDSMPQQFPRLNFPLPLEIFLTIFSLCPSKVIERGKMVNKEFQFFLTQGDIDFWKTRLKFGQIYTFKDLQLAVESLKEHKGWNKVLLRNVEQPLKVGNSSHSSPILRP